jgi:CelD/BcsL family acetyltransferase involved in cellulose biosynthesis
VTNVGATARLVDSLDRLAPICAEWDELAVAAGRPFSAPGWALSWWRHLRPERAQLRVLVLESGDGLAGVVPMYATGGVYRPIGAELAPVEPVSRAGLEGQLMEAASEQLAVAQPRARLVELGQHGSGVDWAGMLSNAWSGGRGAWRWAEAEAPAPEVDFGGGFEAWMSGKSKSFRRDIRSSRRKLDEGGGAFRFATAETLESDVREFLRLHRMRLSDRGGTNIPAGEGVERMLVAVGRDLLPSERFRLLCLDLDGEVIAADLLLSAGSEVSAWNSGFDETHRDFSPIMQCLIYALADAAERGERTMSLGPGGQSYKYRLSSSEDCLRSSLIVPRGPSYPLARLRLVPRQARRAAANRLSSRAKQRLRRLGVS